MRRLIIENIGPIKHVDLELAKVNVFVGPQGAGKSTLAKIISFCSWLEKHRADDVVFSDASSYLKTYHRMASYFKTDSRIFYLGEDIVYAYGWKADALPISERFMEANAFSPNEKEIVLFAVAKKNNPKVIYIPAERNFVASVPNLQNYQEDADSLQGFVVDWYNAKRRYTSSTPLPILNLGLGFYSDENTPDSIRLADGTLIRLASAASGYQSLVPLLTVVDWLSNGIYKIDKPFSPSEYEKIMATLENIRSQQSAEELELLKKRLVGFIEGKIYTHTQFVIEEPEQNLFPQTQKDLVYYLISALDHGKNHHLVLTTHSPYILSALNNLLYAHKVAQLGKGELVRGIISEVSWLDFNQTKAYFVADGVVQSIMDEETGMISAEAIDSISDTLNHEFEQLLDIEYMP